MMMCQHCGDTGKIITIDGPIYRDNGRNIQPQMVQAAEGGLIYV